MSPGGLVEQETHHTVSPVLPRQQAPTSPGATAAPPGTAPGIGAPRTGEDALALAARAGADMVGDACVVWRVVDDGRRLEPAATHHRDRRQRHALESFLHQATLEPDSHWPGQVTWHGAPVCLRRARLLDLGIDAGVGMRRARALLVPVLDGDRTVAVIAVLREFHEPAYTLREEVVLRRIGVKAAVGLGARFGQWRRNGDGPDDGGPDDGAKPPLDGPGWSPPPSWLMDHVGVGVWITDRQGSTTYVNSATTELLGVPSPQVVGRPMRDFLDDLPQMLRGEYCMDAERCDRRLTQPDGRHVWLEMTSAPLVDDEGRRRGTVSTLVDVTERKQIELSARQRVPRAHRRS
jgi:PAS domain S-box-containing protein